MNNRHRAIADEIVKQLNEKNVIPKQDLHKIGGEVYDVIKWLKNGHIIDEENNGYTKGQMFYTYTNLPDLLTPKSKKHEVVVEEKKDLVKLLLGIISGITAVGMLIFAFLTYKNDQRAEAAKSEARQLKISNDSLIQVLSIERAKKEPPKVLKDTLQRKDAKSDIKK